MHTETLQIGCIIMASGRSSRYGKNKLLEKIGDREVVLLTARHLASAGLSPLVVTRSSSVKDLMDRNAVSCILHEGEHKSDTIHVGIEHFDRNTAGYLFMPADQPLLLPDTLKKLVLHFEHNPDRPVRVGYASAVGSPVLFPAWLRGDLLSYCGERGGMDVLKKKQIVCDVIQAGYEWELWDVDTPAKMEQVRTIYSQYAQILSG